MEISVRKINDEYKEVTVFSLDTSLCSGFLDEEEQQELVELLKATIFELDR